jgi:O-antigen/teichoic acid export membrane protein
VLAASAAVVLCLLLVPHYGALGAALGTAISKFTSNVLIAFVLFRKFRVHPVTSAYVKPVLLVVAGSLAAGVLFHTVHLQNAVLHMTLFLWIVVLTLASPLLTHTLSHSDLNLIGSIERRIRGKTRVTEKLRKWLSNRSATHASDD